MHVLETQHFIVMEVMQLPPTSLSKKSVDKRGKFLKSFVR